MKIKLPIPLFAFSLLALAGEVQAQCAQFYVQGGGTICSVGSAQISLNDYEGLVEYALYRDGIEIVGPQLPQVGHVWTVYDAGEYTVYAATCNEWMSGSATVTIQGPPTVTLHWSSSPTTTFCAGSTISFSATGAGFYEWRVNGGNFLNGTPELPNAPAGTYFVEARGTNNCATSQWQGVTITVNHQVQGSFQPSGPSGLCQDSPNSTFSVNMDAIIGAISIGNWNVSPANAGAIIGTGTSVTIDWSSSYYGTATVSATAYGCGGSSLVGTRNVAITQSRITTLSGNGVVCTNQTYTLTVNNPDPSPAVTYAIYKDGSPFHTFSHPVTDYTWPAGANGVYTLQANNTTCPGDQITGSVTVNRSGGSEISLSVSPSGTTFCQDTNLSFSATGSNGTYTWTVNGLPPPGGTPAIGNVPGTYLVRVEGPNSCGISDNDQILITITPKVATNFAPAGPASALCQDSPNSNFSVDLGTIPGAQSAGNWNLSPATAGSISGSGNSATVDWSSTFFGTATISATVYGCGGSSMIGSRNVSITQSRITTLSGNNVVCTNQTFVLTVNNPDPSPPIIYTIFKDGTPFHTFSHPVSDYSWPAGPNGVYTLSSNATMCPSDQVSGSVTVNRNDGPGIQLHSTPAANQVCEGTLVSFYALQGTSLLWTVNGEAFPENNPVLAGTPGLYNVRVDGLNSCGLARFDTVKVTIAADIHEDLSLTGDASTCQSSTTYSATADAPAVYSWSVSPSSAVSSINSSGGSATIAWVASFVGTATIQVTAHGCSASRSASAQTHVKHPNELTIAIDGPATVCEGTTITFTASGGNSYLWSRSQGGLTSSVNPLVVALDTTTTISVTGSESNCNTPAQHSIQVNVDQKSVAGLSSSTISGKRITLLTSPVYETSTVSGHVGQVLRWEHSVNSNDWTGMSSSAFTTSPPSSLLSHFGEWIQFRAVVKNGVCPSAASLPATYSWGIELNKNYVRSFSPQVPLLTTEALYSFAQDPTRVSIATTYFDGTGRNVQQVVHSASPTYNDLVTPQRYDSAGNASVLHLPFTTAQAPGYFKEQDLLDQAAFYATPSTGVVASNDPMARSVVERSALKRIVEQGAPGTPWQPGTGHTIRKTYGVNSLQDSLLLFRYDHATGAVSLASNQIFYEPGQLHRNLTTDEDNRVTAEFVDKQGKTICRKAYLTGAVKASTQYVHDDFGNLVVVLPPEAIKKLTTGKIKTSASVLSSTLDTWAFQYRYDARRRMSQKKVPGSSWVYMVYDERDRLVLTQDGNQRALNLWSFTKYDGLNRPVLTGIKDTSVTLSQSQMQQVVDDFYAQPSSSLFEVVGGPIHYYSNKSYPPLGEVNKYLTVTYYDDYSFQNSIFNSERLAFIASDLSGQDAAYEENTIGKMTGTKTKLLDDGTWGGSTWLVAANYYDDKGQTIQSISDNYKGGTDRTTMVRDFTGKVLKSKATHVVSDVTWVNRKNVVHHGNRVISRASGWGNSGASSREEIAVGLDGWVEVTVDEMPSTWTVGLSDTDPNAQLKTIDFGIGTNNGQLVTCENATSSAQCVVRGNCSRGDVLKVERLASTVRYFKNDTLVHTSVYSSTGKLLVDASIYANKMRFSNVRSSFSTRVDSIIKQFDYDHSGRLINLWHRLNSGPKVLLSHNDYNELGQLIDKKLHRANPGDGFHQSVDYQYNIRGWLTGINGSEIAGEVNMSSEDANVKRDLFGIQLGYETAIGTGSAVAQFSGNISAMRWSTNAGLGTHNEAGYNYAYDALNRILSATYRSGVLGLTNPLGSFSESGYSYDLNGNIRSLIRNGAGTSVVDNLQYDYGSSTKSNKLLKVTDNANDFKGFVEGTNTGNDYTYDANGNMTADRNKNVTITYNHLNLPGGVKKGSKASLDYIYDALGTRLSQVSGYQYAQKQREYSGEFEYDGGVLKSIRHEEGRIVVSTNEQVYYNNGDVIDNVTAVPASSGVELVTLNEETYIKCSSGVAVSGVGLSQIGGPFSVRAGERYLVRARGYSSFASRLFVNVVGGTFIDDAPAFPAIETWVEYYFVIPAGGSQITVAITGTAPVDGTLFLNDFEIIRIAQSEPEYQYHLNDHLGNVRLTFTTRTESSSDTATYEQDNIATEGGIFQRFTNAKRIYSSLFDRTNGVAPGYSQRLNGSNNEKYGLARSLSVMPGDTVRAEVYGKYVDQNASNWSTALTTLMMQITSGSTGVVFEGAGYASSSTSFPFVGLQDTQGSEGGPRAYLNWLVFDRDYMLLEGGYVRMSEEPKEQGQDVAHEKLSSPDIVVTQPGYLYIYLSNEETTSLEVFFDDFKVEHVQSPVVQSQDYYPFGLMFNGYQRENSIKSRRLFNGGSERQEELDLGVDATKFRMLDPAIGRWWQVDPKVDEFYSLTPYNYSFSNPIRFNDPAGDCPPCFVASAGADAAVNPNGVGAHALGLAQGVQNSIVGLVGAAMHPIETAKGLGNLALAGLTQGNSGAALVIDQLLGTHSYEAGRAVTSALANATDKVVNGGGQERGEVIGEILGAVIGGKGISSAVGATGSFLRGAVTTDGFLFGNIAMKAPISIPVQRFGTMSVSGESAFALKTGTSPLFARTFSAILPKWNDMTTYTRGTIPKGTPIKLGITAPQGLRYPGGALQINTKPRLVTNQESKLIK